MTENCPACNTEATIKLLKCARGYNIHKCTACGLIFTKPLPTDEQLDQFYQGFLFRKPDEQQIPSQIEARKAELTRLFGLAGSSKGKTFLDYGGGVGIAAKAALELGLDTFYFDIDRQAVDFVRSRLKFDESRIFTNASQLASRRFDFILSDNSIEHDKSPADFLSKLYNLLAPGGLLVVKTPNAANSEILFYPRISLLGYLARAMKFNSVQAAISAYLKRWWHCDPPRHLYSFTRNSFEQIIKKLQIGGCEFHYYRIPLFQYSIPELIFARPHKAKRILVGVLTLPLLPIELIIKLAQLILTALGLVSPGGIILKIKR